MRVNYKVNVADNLLNSFELALKENMDVPEEDLHKLKDIIWNWNNFRAGTSWKQQYEFAIAIASAYNVGKTGNMQVFGKK